MIREITRAGWCCRRMAALLTTFLSMLPGLVAQSSAPRVPVALLGGETIYEDELSAAIGGQLLQLKNQEYDLKARALTNLINRRVLEAEARRAGLTADQLLAREVDTKISSPSQSEMEAFYLAQKDRINRPLEEVRPQLEQSYRQARLLDARERYIDGLRRAASIAVSLAPPKVEVTVDPQRLRGDNNSPITIVEFSDFQCPYCQVAQQPLREVLEKYKGKVRVAFRDFPLRQIHPHAQLAAEASRCAAEAGKFWQYHDLLYANQEKLEAAALTQYARDAGIEMTRFESCLASGRFRQSIESDLQAGTAAGVSATPTFFVNGAVLVGGQSVASFERVILQELAKLAK